MDSHGGLGLLSPEAPAADSNGIRAKELYKYYKPNSISTGQLAEPDDTLVALTQLVSCRLNCDRALISLVDRETQYFVAEGVRTLGEDYDEETWAGCTSVPKSGRLCEYTMDLKAGEPGDIPYFEVTDLSADERFNHLPFITSGPCFKYYCGVPITTRKGINIGSLFALDKVVRTPIPERALHFMAVMAGNIMTQLELLRDKADKKRALNMNMCLAAFVDPEYASRKRLKEISPGQNTKIQSLAKESLASPTMQSPGEPAQPLGPLHRPRPSTTQLSSEEALESAQSATVVPIITKADDNGSLEDQEHMSTYNRAASLLYESLSLEGGGGVVFMLDSARGAHTHSPDTKETPVLPAVDSNDSPIMERRQSTGSVLQTPPVRFYGKERESYFGHHPEEVCEVLASAVSSSDQNFGIDPIFTPLAASTLSRLIKKYPRGRLFTLDADLIAASTPSGEDQSPSTPSERHSRKQSSPQSATVQELEFLRSSFPQARQIAFVPLWDAISGRFAPCFIFNSYEFRTMSRSTDFLYCIAFCNCVATEISRLATLSADQQKQNFIGSISHELRSPLHGILGSMEFLNDTDCTAFQHSLIDTANSCAVTLLDTISMVLDYSKLNNFERNTNRVRKGRRGKADDDQQSLLHPSLNIYGFVDLSVITEEVVEGVATGQEFKDITKYDTAEVAAPARSRSMRRQGPTKFAVRRADVEIIIDIAPRDTWAFLTQPGAFRRIVMNLFGNALKYTQKGRIVVSLDFIDEQDKGSSTQTDETTIVRLSVKDTGQGISPQFMRSKLFTPFSQENNLNPGTGLGLSLVKEIIVMLKGDISIQTEVGVGTEVVVKLPMTRNSPPGSTTTSSTPSSGSSHLDRARDETISTVQNICKGQTVAHFTEPHADDSEHHKESAASLIKCITNYFTKWYGFDSVIEWKTSAQSDVIIVDEIDLQALLSAQRRASSSKTKHPLVIVLCTNASRHASVKAYSSAGTLEFVSLPVGPYKLARALKLGFEKMQQSMLNLHSATGLQSSQNLAVEPIVESVERVTLAPTESPEQTVNIIQKGDTLAREDSSNAQMAMNVSQSSSDRSSSSSGHGQPLDAYPFPSDPSKEGRGPPTPVLETEQPLAKVEHDIPKPAITPGTRSLRPPLHRALSRPEANFEATAASPMSFAGKQTNAKGKAVAPELNNNTTIAAAAPRLLLVDDNKINLRLLQTYMTKRAIPPSHISLAEDGAQAVSAFRALATVTPPKPPQIVFMDLSMPVLDGFAATRQIRDVEDEVADMFTPEERPPPALIIALTGLASGRDQSEAFVSGFDLYMTKPVSFKEVGRLLDNWMANGGAQVRDEDGMAVPHGAVTGKTSPSDSRRAQEGAVGL